MKNLKKFISLSALSIVVCLTACKDDPEPDACENGSFSMTLNGGSITGDSFNNTLLKASSGGVSGKRMDIRATDAEGRQLIITFNDTSSGMNGDCISTNAYIPFEEVVTGEENTFLFTYIENGLSYSIISGNLDITSCDADAQKISGTFSFEDGDYEVTNGSFTDMCYTIIQ